MPPRNVPRPRAHLIVLLLAAYLLHMVGLQRTLPILPDVDEGIFVEAAIRVASTGDLDPGFYGNPGTTTIYPLALAAHLWHALSARGMVLQPDPNLLQDFSARAWQYYFLGRLLSVAYNLMAVALTVLVGKRAFGWRAGLAAGWFYALCALVLMHARMVRTDSAATFFGLLALYLMLRLLERPTTLLQVAAGAAIGLALASRYFMLALLPVLIAVDAVLIVQARREGRRVGWWALLAGWLALAAAFLLALPTLLPMWSEVIRDLRTEARTSHVGADGLSFVGNLWWYLTRGLPQSVEWPLALASLAGIAVMLWERRLRALFLLLYSGVFIVGVSLSGLHWHRWLIPILPVLMIAAAVALERAVGWLARERSPRFATRLFGAGVLFLIAWTAARSILLDVRGANANTRIVAREWMMESLPAGSRVLQEPYGAALAGTEFAADEIGSLSEVGDIGVIRERGYDYAVASSDIFNRYLAEPQRYPQQVEFYRALFEAGALVKEFAPAWYEGGPVIRVYRP